MQFIFSAVAALCGTRHTSAHQFSPVSLSVSAHRMRYSEILPTQRTQLFQHSAMLRHAAPCCASGGYERWQCEREPATDLALATQLQHQSQLLKSIQQYINWSFCHHVFIMFSHSTSFLIHQLHGSSVFTEFHRFSGDCWCLVQDRCSLCLSDVGDRWRASASVGKWSLNRKAVYYSLHDKIL